MVAPASRLRRVSRVVGEVTAVWHIQGRGALDLQMDERATRHPPGRSSQPCPLLHNMDCRNLAAHQIQRRLLDLCTRSVAMVVLAWTEVTV